MSLRDQLAAKARRRVVVPVAVSDPSEDLARAGEARAALVAAALAQRGEEPADSRQDLEEALAGASRAVLAHYADVEFVALDPDDFERVAAAYPSESGEDGGLDWKAALPVLAANCAVDETVRDADWWHEQLESGTWSHGEKLTLWQALLHINTSTPDPRVPKG